MTEEQIEKIAELVFQKLVKKQEEWDKQFAEEIRDQVVMDIVIKEKQLPDIDTRINNLQAHLERLLEKELYTEAAAVKERIDELKKELAIYGIRNSQLTALMPTATTSQILESKSDGLRAIKKKYNKDYPTNITTIKYFEKAKEEDFLQYGSAAKNLYLLLLEDL